MNDKPLIIIGASARAAAFSAHRAGYTPYWLDRFGDEDLRQFPGRLVSGYPKQAVGLIDEAPNAPFIYTGALENHPGVLEQLCRRRPLLGNPKPACLGVKDPFRLYDLFQRNGIPCPEIQAGPGGATGPRDWLVKPRSGAGGSGIRFHEGGTVKSGDYLQRYLPGESFSAVFVSGRGWYRLLGVTRQLVGLPEFHAGEFCYCGSIGPVELDAVDAEQWDRIGATVAAEFGLRGLFGVDAVRRGHELYPVEVNPRYTASVEALELALDIQAVKLHCRACEGYPVDVETGAPRRLIGKAILFASEDLVFREFAHAGFSLADIPARGAEIKQGHPALTVMVTGTGVDSIGGALKKAAEQIFENLQPK